MVILFFAQVIFGVSIQASSNEIEREWNFFDFPNLLRPPQDNFLIDFRVKSILIMLA